MQDVWCVLMPEEIDSIIILWSSSILRLQIHEFTRVATAMHWVASLLTWGSGCWNGSYYNGCLWFVSMGAASCCNLENNLSFFFMSFVSIQFWEMKFKVLFRVLLFNLYRFWVKKSNLLWFNLEQFSLNFKFTQIQTNIYGFWLDQFHRFLTQKESLMIS